MIFNAPTLTADDHSVLTQIHEMRQVLKYSVAQSPNRWTGFLRRNTFARALQGSNSIEGIHASLTDAAAIVDDEKPERVEEETYRALSGYRTAMTYVLQTHDDRFFELNTQVIKSIHFMMLSYDLTKAPGQWRPTPISVIRDPGGDVVYEAPDAEAVPNLMNEMVDSLTPNRDVDPIVRAAMAHLNLTMIHPFRDGNGRMARALQTLVMARDGFLSPVFSSIEEWLGRNTDSYYDVLGEVGQGRWHPENDASPWIRFCLRAHFQQAATLIQRNRAMSRAFNEIMKLSEKYGLHERMEMTILDAIFGYKVRAGRYQEENRVSDVVASRDLRRLCELGLLIPVGEKRGRHYIAAQPLKDIYARARIDDVRAPDPYQQLDHNASKKQLMLPGVR